MYESREMIIPEEREYLETSLQECDTIDSKNLAGPVDAVESNLKRHINSHNADDGGNMVKELTLENFDGISFTIIGSNERNIMQNKRQQLQNLGIGSGTEGSVDDNDESFLEEAGYSSLSDFLTQKPCSDEVRTQLTNTDSKVVAESSLSPGGIRTKIISKSGFSQFFVKNTLKGKGVICRSATPTSVGSELPHQINAKYTDKSKVASDNLVTSSAKSIPPSAKYVAKPEVLSGNASNSRITLRDWLNNRYQRVKKTERLYIFRQIIEIVKFYHCQGVPIPDLQPSSFRLSASNQICYTGSLCRLDLNMESSDFNLANIDNQQPRKRDFQEVESASASSFAKKGKYIQDSTARGWWLQLSSRSNLKVEDLAYGSGYEDMGLNTQDKVGTAYDPGNTSLHLTVMNDQLDERWYTTPEEGSCTLAANIYSVGVLLFELLCCFDSEKGHATAMSDLRYRILPPNFLAEYPQEVGFCLWLLHPESSSRPTIREVLQSKLINELPNVYEDELSASIESESTELELISHFLVIAKEMKEKASLKLAEDLSVLEADIQEIIRRQSCKFVKPESCLYGGSLISREDNLTQPKFCVSSIAPRSHPESSLSDLRLIKNIRQLEGAYFSMRNNIQFPESDPLSRSEPDLFKHRGAQYGLHSDGKEKDDTDYMGAFFDGLCKYARYNKFEVRGVLRGPELNSANVICSLSFDRDQEYFAAAGVSKKIKIFDYQAFFNLSVDIHYPETEMPNQSKLNCICWNPYIKNYLASADYDGAVKLWDATTGVDIAQYTEHRRRAWSVDFSQSDPTKLASGSDDFSVKLWSITQKNCLGTIKSHANICSVQFSPHSSNLLAFGSADYKAYCYDLRYTRSPWCTLAGHGKAVSNLKFIDSKTIVSASTDNTLKLWDLSKTTPDGQSINACSTTFGGHTNEKNFVGLSVSDGFIACGSETNEVFTYYRSLPMPITIHKFGCIDPISGKETIEDNGHFVSSVCWRKNSDTVIAANSSGCIKVLQLV
ncbi:unnamed protein product [Rhodiola kirilowii]